MFKFKNILFSILTVSFLALFQTKSDAVSPWSTTLSTTVPTANLAVEKLAGTYKIYVNTTTAAGDAWVIFEGTRGVIISSGAAGMLQAMRQINSSGTILADGLITSRTGFVSTGTIQGTNLTVTIDNLLALSTGTNVYAYDKRGDTLYGTMTGSSQTITFAEVSGNTNALLLSTGAMTISWGKIEITPSNGNNAINVNPRGSTGGTIAFKTVSGNVTGLDNPNGKDAAANQQYVDSISAGNTNYAINQSTYAQAGGVWISSVHATNFTAETANATQSTISSGVVSNLTGVTVNMTQARTSSGTSSDFTANTLHTTQIDVASGTARAFTANSASATTVNARTYIFGDGTIQTTAASGSGGSGGGSTTTIRLGSMFDAFVATNASQSPSSWVFPRDTFTITGMYAYCLNTSTVADTIMNVVISTETGGTNVIAEVVHNSSFTVPANQKYSTYTAPNVTTTVNPQRIMRLYYTVVPTSGTVTADCGIEMDGFKWPR